MPFGYTGCLILCTLSKIWFKVMDRCADAANKGEKLDEKTIKEINYWISGTLFFIAVGMSYLNFFVVGFQPRYW